MINWREEEGETNRTLAGSLLEYDLIRAKHELYIAVMMTKQQQQKINATLSLGLGKVTNQHYNKLGSQKTRYVKRLLQ